MLQHTQAMPPFCFRIVCAACRVDSADGMTAVPMSSNMEMQRSCSTVEHLNLAKTWADHASGLVGRAACQNPPI